MGVPFHMGDPVMAKRHVAGLLATALLPLLAPTSGFTAHHESAESTEAQEGAEPEAGERKPWDQERMTELSGELADATSALRRAFRQEPTFRNPKTPNRNAVHQMEQTLRNLEIATRRLHNRVSAGNGFEGTRGTARRIGVLLNDADMWGRRIMTSAFMAERIKPAMELINAIAPYYGSGPLYDPETMQRFDRPPNPDRPSETE